MMIVTFNIFNNTIADAFDNLLYDKYILEKKKKKLDAWYT